MTLPADKAEEVVDTTKTDKTVVNDDLSDEELEQIAEERARIDEQKAIEKKNSTKSYIQQLREEKAAEKARADAAEERELNLKKQGEFDVACATFGEEVINTEQVKGYKERHPDLSYEECVKLAGFEPKKTARQSFIGRASKNIGNTSVYKTSELVKMSDSDRREIVRRSIRGEVKIED